MSKSLEYWRKQWDNPSLKDDNFEEAACKTLSLLESYASFFKTFLGPIGGSVGRFFSGRWNTHHGKAVQNAISKYYIGGCNTFYWDKKYQAIDVILSYVKEKVGVNPINKDGDLYKILTVIKEKTDIDYFALNELEVLQKVRNNSRFVQ